MCLRLLEAVRRRLERIFNLEALSWPFGQCLVLTVVSRSLFGLDGSFLDLLRIGQVLCNAC